MKLEDFRAIHQAHGGRVKKIFLFITLTWLSLCLANTLKAEIKDKNVKISLPERCIAGQKIELKLESPAELPASSFYRVEIDCPKKPAGANITSLAGYPVSEIQFSAAGEYQCDVEIGIVTKNSCAGASYRKLSSHRFKIEAIKN